MYNSIFDISFSNIGFNQSGNLIVLMLLNIGLLLILIEGSMRGIIGLIVIGFSINIYIMNKGYILIPLLLLLSLVSISIIIFIIKYNISNVYKNEGYSASILILLSAISYIGYINSFNGLGMNMGSKYVAINNIELIGYVLVFESNLLLFLLIFIIFMFIIVLIKFSNRITISYNIHYFNVMNYVIMNIFILFAIALLICYIPIIIRYKSKIYKWSSDIYEVGVGVNLSNSLFHSISNNNIGNYFIYFYIYFFIFLDLVINIIIVGFFLNINSLLFSFILLFMALALFINSSPFNP